MDELLFYSQINQILCLPHITVGNQLYLHKVAYHQVSSIKWVVNHNDAPQWSVCSLPALLYILSQIVT